MPELIFTKSLQNTITIKGFSKAFASGDSVILTEEQLKELNIQIMIKDNMLKFKKPNKFKIDKIIKIFNNNSFSIATTKFGILKQKSFIEIFEKDSKGSEIEKLINSGTLSLNEGIKEVKETKNIRPDKPLVYIPKELKDDAKSKKGKKITSVKERLSGESDDFIENGMEGEESDIKFVDIEDTKNRIAAHPYLSRLNKK